MLNPNVLYLQTTPMSEVMFIALLIMSTYYLLVWAQEKELLFLIFAALSVFLCTLVRYEAWVLFLAFGLVIGYVGLVRAHPRSRIEET